MSPPERVARGWDRPALARLEPTTMARAPGDVGVRRQAPGEGDTAARDVFAPGVLLEPQTLSDVSIETLTG